MSRFYYICGFSMYMYTCGNLLDAVCNADRLYIYVYSWETGRNLIDLIWIPIFRGLGPN